MTSDHAGALLLQQAGHFEDRGQGLAKAVDHGLDPADVIEDVAEIGAGLRIDTGQIQAGELADNLAHRSQHALEPDQLATDVEQALNVAARQKGVDGTLLHGQHFFLDRLAEGKIAVHDEVQDGVQDVVHALRQLSWGGLQLLP